MKQTESYTYDAENRLSRVSVTDKDGKTAVIQQNRYNGDGQRIQKVEGSETTNYYYQDGVVCYTTDGADDQTSQNLIGMDGNILATQRYGSDDTDYLLYNKDIQGSTSSLVKEDGSADATYRYTDFGETTINGDNKAGNEVCYTGGIYDESTGLYYLNARYYDPEDGRFVTEDTYRGEVDDPDTGHLYAYCTNNPVNYVDSSGHFAVAIPLGWAIGEAVLTALKYIVIAGVTYVAASAIATLKRKQPKIHYYKAKMINAKVYIYDAIKTKSKAAARLKVNGNVFATSSGYAYDACKAASPIHKVSAMQKHKKEKGQGKQYYHYHPMLKWSKNKNARKQMHVHCWFLK